MRAHFTPLPCLFPLPSASSRFASNTLPCFYKTVFLVELKLESAILMSFIDKEGDTDAHQVDQQKGDARTSLQPDHGTWRRPGCFSTWITERVRIAAGRIGMGRYQEKMNPPAQYDHKACVMRVAAVFPGIAPDFLRQVSLRYGYDARATIDHIVDQLDAGYPYPRRQQNANKRKRCDESEDITEADDDMTEIRRKYDNPERRALVRPEGQTAML